MKRKIVLIGNPVLTRDCEPVFRFDRKIRVLVRDLFETMYDANGVGLAAPQIGISLRVAVIDVVPKSETVGRPITLINPQIVSYEGTQIGEEGCLSIPNVRVEIVRPYSVTVSYQQEDGKEAPLLVAQELLARAICHEMDHLDGRLITDYAMMNESIQ